MFAFFLSVGLLIIVGAVLGRLSDNTSPKIMLGTIIFGILVALVSLFYI